MWLQPLKNSWKAKQQCNHSGMSKFHSCQHELTEYIFYSALPFPKRFLYVRSSLQAETEEVLVDEHRWVKRKTRPD